VWWEPFDLAKDPLELKNEYSNAEYSHVVEELKKEPTQLQTELQDNIKDTRNHPRTGMK